MTDSDPTAIPMELDPLQRRFRGVAYHGKTPFDVPYISEIVPGFWQGGCEDGLILPRHIQHVVSLYPWEEYDVVHDLDSFKAFTMYDSIEEDPFGAVYVADYVNMRRVEGCTLVHCQAGLNRSGLVAALALIRGPEQMTGAQAIHWLRAKRSPAVLCNPAFEEFVLDYA